MKRMVCVIIGAAAGNQTVEARSQGLQTPLDTGCSSTTQCADQAQCDFIASHVMLLPIIVQ
jgi:hypothetical protein